MPVPGSVTSNLVGSTFQNLSPEAERRMYELEDERKRKREESNAAIMAQRGAQQQAAQNEQDRARVREAFNALYGPQMQAAYHDQMVTSEGVPGTGVQSKGLGMAPGGQSRLSSGNMKPWSEPGSYTPQGGWYQLPQEKLNRALDNMWRMRTDPYTRAAGQLGSGVSLGLPMVGGGAPSGGGGGGGGSKKKSTTKKQEEQPGGIDWWKNQNQGSGEMQYERMLRG